MWKPIVNNFQVFHNINVAEYVQDKRNYVKFDE